MMLDMSEEEKASSRKYLNYLDCKDSGHKWLGTIPNHWKMIPSKRLFPESKVRAAVEDIQLSATQDYGVISQEKFMRFAGRRVVQLNSNQELRKRVEVGDFVISMRSFQGGLERAWEAGGIRSSYVVLRPVTQLERSYYQYLFKCQNYVQALQSTANFIRDGQDLNYQNFVLIDLPYPDVEEQHTIAAFLDYETARIDRLIEKQQRLIELLKEKRQAVISHAVTKGLNPDAPMKDSGVEWLGQVPEHWMTKRLKHCASLVSQKQRINAQLVIALENIESFTGQFVKTDSSYTGEDVAFAKGDVLFGKLRPYLSKVHRCETNGIAFGDVLTYRPHEQTGSEYLFYTMISSWFVEIVNSSTYGAKMPRASSEFINEMLIAVPPFKEQSEIAIKLTTQLQALDDLVSKANSAINLMRERRTALISAAVTGKIDLRNWSVPKVRGAV